MNTDRPSKNRPIEILRDGSLKATIWENESENGVMYSTTLARTYHANDGSLRDSHSFSGSELLRVAELARQTLQNSGIPAPICTADWSLNSLLRSV